LFGIYRILNIKNAFFDGNEDWPRWKKVDGENKGKTSNY
jgi:hypothetical protein